MSTAANRNHPLSLFHRIGASFLVGVVLAIVISSNNAMRNPPLSPAMAVAGLPSTTIAD